MKKIYLLLTMVTLSIVTFSCDEDDDRNVFDGPTTTYFEETSYSINAVDDLNNTTELILISSSSSNVDRQYTLQLDESSSAVMGTDFMLSSSAITIPAGSYSGTVTVTSMVTESTIDGVTAILNLVDSNEIAVFDNAATVEIRNLTCELFPAIPFTGDYMLEQVGGDNGFGPAFVSTGTVVTVSDAGEGVRTFESIYLGDFGQGNMVFSFSLNCGEIVVPADQFTGLSCGGPINIQPGEVVENYTPYDDTEILVTFFEDIPSGCGAAAASETTIKLTKII